MRSALAALVALAVSPFFVIVAHLNLLDQAFTFFLTAAVLAFAYAQCRPPRSTEERTWMLLAWGAAALAVLSKGIVVGVLAGAALILYTLFERDTLTWRRLHIALGLPLFVLIAAPWFVLVTLRNPSFPQFFFVHEHFARFLTTVHSGWNRGGSSCRCCCSRCCRGAAASLARCTRGCPLSAATRGPPRLSSRCGSC